MTEAFDLDDEPTPTAKSEAAAAISGHPIVMQHGDTLTADMLDEFHGFVQEELAVLLEEKKATIAYLAPSPTPTPSSTTRSDAPTSCRL